MAEFPPPLSTEARLYHGINTSSQYNEQISLAILRDAVLLLPGCFALPLLMGLMEEQVAVLRQAILKHTLRQNTHEFEMRW